MFNAILLFMRKAREKLLLEEINVGSCFEFAKSHNVEALNMIIDNAKH